MPSTTSAIFTGSGGKIPEALAHYQKSLSIEQEIGNKMGMATSYNNIGYIYRQQGKIPEALAHYQKSLSIQQEIGDKKGMANSYNNIGYIYQQQGKIPEALAHYQKSLSIEQEIWNKMGMATSYNNIGTIYRQQGKIPEALAHFQKSLSIRQEIGNKKGMATSYNNIGYIYQQQGKIPEALAHYQKSLSIRQETGDKSGMATSYNNIGSIYRQQGKIPEVHPVERDSLFNRALAHYQKSLSIEQEIGNKKGMAASYNNIGYIYHQQGKIPEVHPVERDSLFNRALAHYQKSLSIRQEIGDKKGMAYSFNNIGNLYFEKERSDLSTEASAQVDSALYYCHKS